jgi:three-Cys-motif partner protein
LRWRLFCATIAANKKRISMAGPRIDEIGPWSEVKLDILRRYAVEYSRILSNQRSPAFFHVYIDAFAGAGFHLSEASGEMVSGSPLNALQVDPPFREFHLIDLDGDKIDGLSRIIGERKDVFLHKGDCNEILLRDVFPRVLRENYRRGLCLLDPYGLSLDWQVVRRAGEMQSLDIFINFPIYDININVLHRDPSTVLPLHVTRMNAFWGDQSWREIAYEKSQGLFGPMEEKVTNERLAEAYRDRLRKVAGFKKVPPPLAMRNRKNSIVYYLFFGSHKGTAENIVTYIFDKFGKH